VANGDGLVVVTLVVVLALVAGVPVVLLLGDGLDVGSVSPTLAVPLIVVLALVVIVAVFAR
jgi:hypothetical protein